MVLAGSPPLVLRDALNTHVCGESGRGRLFARSCSHSAESAGLAEPESASSERVRFWRGKRETVCVTTLQLLHGRFRNVDICVS